MMPREYGIGTPSSPAKPVLCMFPREDGKQTGRERSTTTWNQNK
jgi:hypothetical protein